MFRLLSLCIFLFINGQFTFAQSVTLSMNGKADTPASANQLDEHKVELHRSEQGSLRWVSDVATPHLYDPDAKKSRPNKTSLEFNAGDYLAIEPLPGQGSFTLEMYVKPKEIPGQDCWIAEQSRKAKGSAEFGIGLQRLHQFNQTYWAGYVIPQDGKPTRWTMGNYLTIGHLNKNTTGWRHLALVVNNEDQSVTTYLDHWVVHRERLSQPLDRESGPIYIGTRPGTRNGFTGLIDDIRLTAKPLKPADFLRAVDQPMDNVSFESEATVLPPSSGYIDLKEGFGAVGDGRHDDTLAFQTAFASLANKVPLAYYTLYIPPGEYLVSDMLYCSRFIVIRGAGRDRTIIRLKDQSKPFQNAKQPLPVIRASSTAGDPGSNRAVNGSSIGIFIADMTIDTGRENPGAKGIEYHSNNNGSMERVTIRSGDGNGPIGLDLTHKTNGPALIKDVSVVGFDYGMKTAWQEYSLTFENIRLEKQNKAGIYNDSNILAIRKLTSTNQVPAIVSRGAGSMITVLDSELSGGSKDNAAIQADGALYARNIGVKGYGVSIEKKRVERINQNGPPKFQMHDLPAVTGDIEEWWGDQTVAPFGDTKAGSLKLPIEETPNQRQFDVTQDWANVDDYAHLVRDGDWTAAIQAAIDSGKPSVVFPRKGYQLSGTVILRNGVKRLEGMRSSLARPKDFTDQKPMVIYEESEPGHELVIEHLDFNGLFHHQ